MDERVIAPGMNVTTSDGRDVGTIARIFLPSGEAVPPEAHPQEGTFTIGAVGRESAHNQMYVQVNRVMAPDWFVTAEHIAAVAENTVILEYSYDEAFRLPLQEKPV